MSLHNLFTERRVILCHVVISCTTLMSLNQRVYIRSNNFSRIGETNSSARIIYYISNTQFGGLCNLLIFCSATLISHILDNIRSRAQIFVSRAAHTGLHNEKRERERLISKQLWLYNAVRRFFQICASERRYTWIYYLTDSSYSQNFHD